jgi:hypothetical protein
MENQEILDSGQSTDPLILNDRAVSGLETASKWAFFLSILGYVLVGLMVLMSVIMLFASISKLGTGIGVLIFALYMAIAGLYFIPIRLLQLFADGTKTALARNDETAMGEALEKLGKHYRFIGILTIVIMALYGLVFVFSLLKLGGMGMM